MTIRNPLSQRPLVVRPGQVSVRTTFQVAGCLTRREGAGVADPSAHVRALVADWIQHRCGLSHRAHILEAEAFEDEDAGAESRLECVGVPEEGRWALRHTSALGPDGDEPEVPGRFWVTEIALTAMPDGAQFGVRVLCSSSLATEAPIGLRRPQIVSALASELVMREADTIDGRPIRMQCEKDIDRLFRLVSSAERGLPVYLLTEPDRTKLRMPTGTFLLDAEGLAARVLGVAYVVTMPRQLGFRWTDLVGKPWSAFLGAVRTYRPGVDFDQDDPRDHPLALAEWILRYRYKGLTMDEAYAEFLVDQAHEHSASRWVNWGSCLFYVDARNRRAERGRMTAREDKQWRAVYEEEIAALKAKIDQVGAERDDAIEVAETAERERDQARRENFNLRAQLDALRRAVGSAAADRAATVSAAPSSYADVPGWVEANLTGRLSLHPRAVNQGLKDAEFENVKLVCDVLRLLADDYRDMRLGVEGAKSRFDQAIERMNLRMSGSISKERAGEQGDTYFVRLGGPGAPRRFLDTHIRTNSATRDPKRCLAVYFYWDEDNREVVVGWLPGHLANRLT
ncbi:MAG: hypothetical protein BroJett003_26190 [Planctomycetota bacterium]|nr:MAG: hypothetical protein BroJett003_26190 [Planctomycetota bacterium]